MYKRQVQQLGLHLPADTALKAKLDAAVNAVKEIDAAVKAVKEGRGGSSTSSGKAPLAPAPAARPRGWELEGIEMGSPRDKQKQGQDIGSSNGAGPSSHSHV